MGEKDGASGNLQATDLIGCESVGGNLRAVLSRWEFRKGVSALFRPRQAVRLMPPGPLSVIRTPGITAPLWSVITPVTVLVSAWPCNATAVHANKTARAANRISLQAMYFIRVTTNCARIVP
jgi:hypothetical protein